jgi:phosphoglycerate dehydrogenase-like enzyme
VTPTVAVTFDFRPRERAVVVDALKGVADPVFVTDLDPAGRAASLQRADVVLARNTNSELQPNEPALLASAKLIQFMTAGIDFVKLSLLPKGVPVAANGGAYAGPMAEHALAMVLAGAKRLIVEHQALARGEFHQFARNRLLAGGTCGILGFGGIGEASARLFRALDMKIFAINRRGASEEPTDWIGTMDQIDTLLAASDVVIVATPLTPQTNGFIGARELAAMKPTAILANLARGEVIQEGPLFAHLKAHPDFIACIDAWWVEPERQGSFRMDYPFMTLPNVIGSPHNSASVPGITEAAIRRAAINIRRVLRGEAPRYTLAPHEHMG